jgi:hypothetical protein
MFVGSVAGSMDADGTDTDTREAGIVQSKDRCNAVGSTTASFPKRKLDVLAGEEAKKPGEWIRWCWCYKLYWTYSLGVVELANEVAVSSFSSSGRVQAQDI